MRVNFSFRRFLVPRYVIGATLPYVLLSLLMLTAVLFAQQAERLAEVVLYVDLPIPLLAGIGAALIPGVLIFTIPMATLAGVEIRSFDAGASRQNRAIQTECGQDSEQTR